MLNELAQIEDRVHESLKQLTELIKSKGNALKDPEVITAIEILGVVLNTYNELQKIRLQKPVIAEVYCRAKYQPNSYRSLIPDKTTNFPAWFDDDKQLQKDPSAEVYVVPAE